MPKYYKRVRVEYTFYSDAIEADTETKAEAIAVVKALDEPVENASWTVETYNPEDFVGG